MALILDCGFFGSHQLPGSFKCGTAPWFVMDELQRPSCKVISADQMQLDRVLDLAATFRKKDVWMQLLELSVDVWMKLPWNPLSDGFLGL
uniref:Uncharacterized protein n=1 Tax=Cucumis sativus TaxID=3659 RepID=A0A0A0KCW8_CUCSA